SALPRSRRRRSGPLRRAGRHRGTRGDPRSGPQCGGAVAATGAGGGVVSVSVFDELVGQDDVVATLRAAVAGQMTHAWLFTGPPGSGRSNAALAFAAALQCEAGGCGECRSCLTAAAGSHPDIAVINTDGLSIGVDAARDAVR